ESRCPPRRLDDGSRVTRERHARFNERRGVQLPPATHLPKTTNYVAFGTQTAIMGVVAAGDAGDSCS
ncbi:MAG: hypothetical protein ACRDSR_22495, partial [Pseudonocardiaceae bacterium]